MSVLEWQPILNPELLLIHPKIMFIDEYLIVKVINTY